MFQFLKLIFGDIVQCSFQKYSTPKQIEIKVILLIDMLLINYLHSHHKKVHYHHNLLHSDIRNATLHSVTVDSSIFRVHQPMLVQ